MTLRITDEAASYVVRTSGVPPMCLLPEPGRGLLMSCFRQHPGAPWFSSSPWPATRGSIRRESTLVRAHQVVLGHDVQLVARLLTSGPDGTHASGRPHVCLEQLDEFDGKETGHHLEVGRSLVHRGRIGPVGRANVLPAHRLGHSLWTSGLTRMVHRRTVLRPGGKGAPGAERSGGLDFGSTASASRQRCLSAPRADRRASLKREPWDAPAFAVCGWGCAGLTGWPRVAPPAAVRLLYY
jgi:hypothetical protein